MNHDNPATITHRDSGLTLVEVLLASVILAISASGILTAFAAGHEASSSVNKRQQAFMLAANMMEEIKRLDNYEGGDYQLDEISGAGAEAGESCSPARNCFDDKTDFSGYADGSGIAATGNAFVDFAGNPIDLGTPNTTPPLMYRTVEVFLNDLNGSIADFNVEAPFLEVHVVVYEGAFGSGKPEMIRLRQVFGSL